jgi:hypothetical protein
MVAFKKRGWSFYGVDRWTQCVEEGYLNFGREKCHLKGLLKVKRGTGHFHIGLGANNVGSVKSHAHDLSSITTNHSLSHIIRQFSVGTQLPQFVPPLQNVEVALEESSELKLWVISYFVHIVPARHSTVTERVLDGFRYSVMYSQKTITNTSLKGLPGIHFYYDFSPMMVVSSASALSLRTFLTRLAAIVGGTFSFAAILDALMFGAVSTLEGKRSIGKDV